MTQQEQEEEEEEEEEEQEEEGENVLSITYGFAVGKNYSYETHLTRLADKVGRQVQGRVHVAGFLQEVWVQKPGPLHHHVQRSPVDPLVQASFRAPKFLRTHPADSLDADFAVLGLET